MKRREFNRLITGGAVFGATLGAGGLLAGPAEASLTSGFVDEVVVVKAERRLYLLNRGRVVRDYRVALGRYPVGHKLKSGDARTPEGRYIIDRRLRDSAFHRALHISYPNEEDLERAKFLGVNPGGAIMVHGLADGWTARQLGHPKLDWTQGCIAVTNREIEEIWSAVPDETPITIHP